MVHRFGLFLLFVGLISSAQAMNSDDGSTGSGSSRSGAAQRMNNAMRELQLSAERVAADSSDDEAPENKRDRALVRWYESASRRFARIEPTSDHARNQQILLDVAHCKGEVITQIKAFDGALKTLAVARLGRVLNGLEKTQARFQNFESGVGDSESSEDELDAIVHVPPQVALNFRTPVRQ